MFWKRERKPLLREIAEGLNISAAREKGEEIEEDFDPFEEDAQPKDFSPRKTEKFQQTKAPGSESRKKILVDDFVVQRFGDQESLYIEEPPNYPGAGQSGYAQPENRHPYLKTPLPESRERPENPDSPPAQGYGADGGDALAGRLQLLNDGIDDIHRITLRQEDLFSKWGQLTERLDSLSKMAEDLDRLNPFLTKFYDLERKLAGVIKLEERIQSLETGVERLVPALENMDDDLRLLAVKVTENQPNQSGSSHGLPDPDRIRELSGMIDEKLEAFSKLEEKMASLTGHIPDVALPNDRFDRLELKIDEKLQAVSSLDRRLAHMEERVSARPEAGEGPLPNLDLEGLDRKLEILAALDNRLAAMEDKMTALGKAPQSPQAGEYQQTMTRVEETLNSLGQALKELPRLTQQLEKLDEINRYQQQVENKFLETSHVIDRELSDLKASSPEEKSDHRVTMVFDDDQWKEEY